MLKAGWITIRGLARRPSFALAAMGTLAVGVGATTAIFSTVNATLLRPLPYPEAQELYALHTRLTDGRYTSGRDRLAGAHIYEINEKSQTVKHAVAYSVGENALMPEEGPPRDVAQITVSQGFFDLFGAAPAAGRWFAPEDHTPAPTQQVLTLPDGTTQTFTSSPLPSVVVLSHRIWTEVYGADPELIDREIRLRGRNVRVVGVAPRDFDVPPGTDIWLAFNLTNSVGVSYQGYLRANPGVAREQIESELQALALGLEERIPSYTARTYVITPLNESIVGDLGPILLVVLAGAIVLLVLGCVNVATLMLARGAGQTKEMAVRAALGADRGRIMGRFLGESLVLSVAGTLAGLFLAYAGIQLLLAYGGTTLPRLDAVPFDQRVLLFAAGVLVLATVLVGLLPALRLSSPDIRGLLSEGGRSATGGRGTRRLLGGLVVAEIALAIMLVAGAGWLVRSYLNLSDTRLGFEAQGRLLVDPLLPETPAVVQSWMAQAPERLLAIPQVTRLGSGALPLRPFFGTGYYVAIPGDESYDPNRQNVALITSVSQDFFDAIGARIVAGRALVPEDRPPQIVMARDPATGQPRQMLLNPATGTLEPLPEGGATIGPPRVVVNQAFVDWYLGEREPIGARFAYGAPTVNFNSLQEIVGVVDNLHYRTLRDVVVPVWYTPIGLGSRRWVVETTLADPTPLIPTIRAVLNEVDPTVQVDIEPLSGLVTAALWRHRLGLLLMSLFAALSLGLAAIGIFGVIAHATGQRTRELATRMALGASPGGVVAVLLSQARALSALGVALGVGAAYAGGRVAASRLHEVRADDPMILLVATVAVLGVTFVAFLLPALRAARIAPAEALKGE